MILTEKRQIFIAAILNYVTIALGVIISFFYTPYCLSQLGDRIYGIRAFSLSLVSFLSLLSSAFSGSFLKFRAKLIKEKGQDGEKLNNGIFLVIMSFLALIAVIIGVVISIVVGFIPLEDYSDSEKILIQILIIVSTFNIMISFPIGVFEMFVNANRKFIFVRTISLFATIVTPLASVLILMLCPGDPNAVIWISIVVPCVTAAYFPVTLAFAIKKLRFKASFNLGPETKKFIREIAIFSIFILASTIFSEFVRNANTIVLGFERPNDVTAYSIASTLMIYLTTIGAATTIGFYPKTYQLDSEKDYIGVNKLFIKSVDFSSIVVFLIAGGFVAAGKPFIVAWLGDQYVDNPEQLTIIYQVGCILFAAQLFPLTSLLSIEIMRNRNKHVFQTIALAAMLLMTFALAIPLCYYFGPIGGAWGLFVSLIIGYGIVLPIFNWKVLHLPITKYYSLVGIMVLLAGVSVGCALLLDHFMYDVVGEYHWLLFLIDGSAFVIIYSILCLIFKRKTIKEVINAVFKRNNA